MKRDDHLTPQARQLARTTRDAPVPMALFDAEGRFLAASKSWRKITNIWGRDYVGLTIAELGAGPRSLIEHHRRAAAGEHFVSEEEEYIDDAGVRRWLSCEYRPLFGPDDKLRAYYAHGHDITPTLTARREAQASAERLSLALGAARAGVSEFDFENKTMWASPEFAQIVGVEVDFRRFARQPWYMAHKDDRALIDRVVNNWTGARHEPFDIRVVLPNGDIRWVEVHGEQELDARGRRKKIVGLILDIDARKRQELALADARREAQANAERLTLAMTAARVGVCEFDHVTNSFWCSPEFTDIVGRQLSMDDFMERHGWPGCHPDDAAGFRQLVLAWKGVRHEPYDFRIILPSGQVRWVQIHSQRETLEDGSTSKIVALLLDIDARKRQELALAEARGEAQINAERLGLALEAARAGVFEVSFTSQTFWSSPQFAEIAGRELTFEEAAGDVWPIVHPDDQGWMATTVRGWMETFSYGSLEARVVLPSGETRWLHGRAIIHFGEDGKPEKLAGLVLDIDARKRQELALVEAERAAQAAAEAKSQFLANMSHEIRTPMNGVLGVLHLLEQENLSEEGRYLLDEASNCGRMLAQLLNDVIDFSRIEAGRLELSPEPLDAAQVLRSVAGLLRPNATAKGLTLRACTPDNPVWIQADPVRLRQALFNLIGNAVKFTSEGHVEVRLTVAGEGELLSLRFEIEDTGVGIPEAVQTTLFRRFQQADGSTSRRFGGSGLGLAITRRLAELMDGEVGFVSREGEGSTFWFGITAPAAEPVNAAAAERPPPALTGLHILLVEDNPTNRLVASKMLEAMGVRVTMAADGRLGVDAAVASTPDLILMDVQMPVMDGLEATRAIRALGGAVAKVPIVGLTANAMSHQQRAYLDAGMSGVVAKPISPAALIAEIARVMAMAGDGPGEVSGKIVAA